MLSESVLATSGGAAVAAIVVVHFITGHDLLLELLSILLLQLLLIVKLLFVLVSGEKGGVIVTEGSLADSGLATISTKYVINSVMKIKRKINVKTNLTECCWLLEVEEEK